MIKRCALCGTPLAWNRIWVCDCGGRKGETIDPDLPIVTVSPRLAQDLDRVADGVTRVRREQAAMRLRSEFRVIEGGRAKI